MIYVGIDPGVSGAIAALDGDKVTAVKMPATPDGIWSALVDTQPNDIADGSTFCLEKVHASVRRDEKGKAITQGVASSWKFAVNFGWLQMACCLLDVGTYDHVIEVSPQVWQKALSLTFTKAERAGKDSNAIYREKKNRNKAMAAELFPEIRATHWNSDALLLAEYARRTHEGKATR